jgi:hypothetical protein
VSNRFTVTIDRRMARHHNSLNLHDVGNRE